MAAKLEHWEAHKDLALAWVLAFAHEHGDEILHVARARHITGHHVHGDGEMYEFSRGRLTKEVIEELADAVNYALRRMSI